MALIESWFAQDLKKPVKVQYLDGVVFTQDNNGNLVGMNVLDDGEPATVSGTVSANVIRADGGTVVIESGTISGNQVSVVLPEAAYAVPGVISIIIKVTDDTDVATIGCVVSHVYKSTTDTIIDPGTIIPSIQTLITQIQTAVASIPADYSALWTSLAPAYSTSATYAVGAYVTYNGGLYRCITAIPAAESWTSSHWTAAKIGPDLANLKSAINDIETESGSKKNITSLFSFTDEKRINAINGSDNLGKRQSSDYESASGYVNIEGFEYINLSMKYTRSGSSVIIAGLAFYTSTSESSVISDSGTRSPRNPDADISTAIMVKVKVPEGAKYIRTSWWNFSSEQYSTYAFEAYGIIEGELSDRINELDTRMTADEALLESVKNMAGTKDDISGLFTFTNDKRINAMPNGENEGVLQADSSGASATEGFVDIEGYTHLLITRRYMKTSGSPSGLAFYTSDSVSSVIVNASERDPYDTGLAENTYIVKLIKIPATAKYIRTTWWSTDTAQYNEISFSCYGIVAGELENEIDEIRDDISSLDTRITNVETGSKLPRTGTYEFFTVTVERPLAFGGEDVNTETENVECLLQLPTTYTRNGKPTRLILWAHGSSGFVSESGVNDDGIITHWKAVGGGNPKITTWFVNQGYALFDCNIFSSELLVDNPQATIGDWGDVGRSRGSALYVNVLKRAYDYIIDNYNIYDKIFVYGFSMGGSAPFVFSYAYPQIVLAGICNDGSNIGGFLSILASHISDGTVDSYLSTGEGKQYVLAWGYSSGQELLDDKLSHVLGASPVFTLKRYDSNGNLIPPPDRETNFVNWLTYYGNLNDSDIANQYLTAHSPTPFKIYRSTISYPDGIPREINTQKAYTNGGSAPYDIIIYNDINHSEMASGTYHYMREQFLAWLKRWE